MRTCHSCHVIMLYIAIAIGMTLVRNHICGMERIHSLVCIGRSGWVDNTCFHFLAIYFDVSDT